MKYKRYYPSIVVFLILVLLVVTIPIKQFYITACCVFILAVIVLFELIKFIFTYEGELDIQTPDGSNQPYHPSVLFFENAWNGWEYWMAFTPMPIGAKPYTDRWECPCVVVSHDGINWCYPGEKRYLDDLNQVQIADMDYFSDPHLVYDKEKDKLYLYYRLSEGKGKHDKKRITLYRKDTSDGITWSERKKVIYDEIVMEDKPTSPAIMKNSSNNYQMWYVAEGSRKYKHSVYHVSSTDGIHFSKREKVKLANEVDPWHIDCQNIDGKYYMVAFSFDEKLTLLSSMDGMDFEFVKVLIGASNQLGSFYRIGIYRSCLVKDNGSYKLYLSAKSGSRVSIGLMEGNNLIDLHIKSVNTKVKYKFFWKDFFQKYFLIFLRIKKLLSK